MAPPPFPATSPDCLLTGVQALWGVALLAHYISVLPVRGAAEHWEVVGLIGSKCFPLSCLSLQVFSQGCSWAGSQLLLPSAH